MKRHSHFCVYMVKCINGTFYTGYTTDLSKRIALHNKGQGAKYLRGKGPVELVFCQEYRYYKSAVNMEYKIKTWSRAQKEELVQKYQRLANGKTK